MEEKNLMRLAGLARVETRALKSTLDDKMRRSLKDAMSTVLEKRDIYEIITGHVNSEDALNLIRLCSPIAYPMTDLENLNISVETWSKKILAIDYGDEHDDIVRLFISPLEIVFKIATYDELRGIIAYLADETHKLVLFDIKQWQEFSVGILKAS